MNKKKLYILQVQRTEGANFEDLYFDSKTELDGAVREAKKNKTINYRLGIRDANELIPVSVMRVFKMIERIRIS